MHENQFVFIQPVDSTSNLLMEKPQEVSFTDWGAYPFSTTFDAAVYKPLPFKERVVRSVDGVFWLLLLVLVVFAYLRTVKSKRLTQLGESFFSTRFVSQMLREEGVLRSDVNLLMLFSSLIVISISLSFIPVHLSWFNLQNESFGVVFGWMFLLSLGLFIVKNILVKLSNWFFTSANYSQEYIFNSFQFTQAFGLLLFPLVLLHLYTGVINAFWFYWIAFFVGGVMYLGRIVKLVYLAMNSTNFSLVYIILYLCTLEILPLFILLGVLRISNSIT